MLGAVAEPAIAHLLEPVFHAVGIAAGLIHPISFVIALALATYLHMLFGEMVPKNVALAEPVRTALVLGPPLVALTRALRPVIFAINALANGLLKLLRVETRDEVAATFSDDQLAKMVEDSRDAGLLDDRAKERLRDALELGRRPVRDVVLPVEKVVSARMGITPEGLERMAADSGFSRFPVVDDTRRILGYLHVKDALDATPRDMPFTVAALRPIARVKAATLLDDVLTAMREFAYAPGSGDRRRRNARRPGDHGGRAAAAGAAAATGGLNRAGGRGSRQGRGAFMTRPALSLADSGLTAKAGGTRSAAPLDAP